MFFSSPKRPRRAQTRNRRAWPWDERSLRLERLEPRQVLASVSLLPSQDNTLFEDTAGELSNGAGEYLFVGRTGQPAGRSLRRGLVAFDVGSAIPAGATVTNVSLSLNMSRTISGSESVRLHRVTTGWGEGSSNSDNRGGGAGTQAASGDATWLHSRFDTSFWNQSGGDFASGASAETLVGDTGGYVWSSSQMLADVQAWIDNPAANFGWILIGNESADSTAKRFDSKENGSVSNRPALTIEFDEAAPDVSISINGASISEGDQGQQILSFTVALSAAPTQNVSVNFATQADTATAGSDFTATSGTLTFTAGGPSQRQIDVPILGDLDVEPDEQFLVRLSSPVNGTLANDTAVGTIRNDDQASPQASISVTNATVSEGDAGTTPLQFVVTLSAASSQAVSVNYATASGTATSGQDFTSASGTLNFAPGETQMTVSVNVLGDTQTENDESFTLNLSNPVNATLANGQATGTILDDDDVAPTVAISVVGNSATEGDAGTTPLTFTVSLSLASTETVTVQYATVAGTAAAGQDFTSASGTLTFAPGEIQKSVSVNVLGDTQAEGNETFLLRLSNPQNSELSIDQATGTIVDDDGQTGGPRPWQNPVEPMDVNNSGFISPLDVLIIINEINANGIGPLAPPSSSSPPPPFFDVNGDDALTIMDFFLIINHINARASALRSLAGPPPGEADTTMATRQPEVAPAHMDHDARMAVAWDTALREVSREDEQPLRY